MAETIFPLGNSRPFPGHVRNDESAGDMLPTPFHLGHQLSGPFRVEGAKPGDLLVVDISDACAALYLPTAISDIRPSTSRLHQVSSGLQPLRVGGEQLSGDDILRTVPKDKTALLPATRRLGEQVAQPAGSVFGKLRELLGRC